jgi:superfamily II DNA or RNA helicase
MGKVRDLVSPKEVVVGKSFHTFFAALPSDSHSKGKQFERAAKWFLENDPIWSGKVSKVWLWNEWPERNGPDIGIDLVAEMDDGLWAIQSKCFDSNRSIPKSELDSFISAASMKKFDHRLLIATTDQLSPNASRMLNDNHVVRVLLSQLLDSPLTWPEDPRSLTKVDFVKAIPRDYQVEAINQVTSGFETADRGQLIMACGTGKTLTALWIMEKLDPDLTLILVPSLSLLSQTLTQWAANRSANWSYLCVCSDETVSKADDQVITTVEELPFPATTDEMAISRFLQKPGKKVIFSTYQSSAKVADAIKASDVRINFMICDEAHRLSGKSDSQASIALSESRLPSEKRLFMTATPRTFTQGVQAKGSEVGVTVNSMDDVSKFGRIFHLLSFGDAIKEGLLTDYRVVIVGISSPQVLQLVEQRAFIDAGDISTDARTLAAHIGLAKAIKDFNLSRLISFHSRVKTAKSFANDHLAIVDHLPITLRTDQPMWSEVISGEMSTGERRKLLEKLRFGTPTRPTMLTNARCLTEGIDVPSLDGVAFIDPKQSQVDIVQAVGRAIRRSVDKTMGTIVLPVLIDTEQNSADISDTDFKQIWNVVNALRSHDNQLGNELDAIRFELGKKGKVLDLPSKIFFDLPSEVLSLDPFFADAVTLRLLEQTSDNWEWWFGLLNAYTERTGHAKPSYKEIEQGQKLGQWVVTQRTALKEEQEDPLLLSRKARLESLPGWVWNVNEASWQERFEALKEYSAEFGNARPPTDFIYKDIQLGEFVSVLRWGYKSYGISKERIELLESLPGWAWNKYDGDWLDYYAKLNTFLNEKGEWPSFTSKDSAERSLAMWAGTQRKNREKLTESKVNKLESLEGWSWDLLADLWDNQLKQAISLFNETGGLLPGKSSRGPDPILSRWIAAQKKNLAAGKISKERLKKLSPIIHLLKIETTSVRSDKAWQSFFKAVQAFANLNGDSNASYDAILDGKAIGSWVIKQRSYYKEGKLSSDQVRQLESLPKWTWSLFDESWETSFMELKSFGVKNGHLLPHSKKNKDLNYWINSQRKLYRKGNYNSKRAEQLSSLPGWSWVPSEMSLDKALEIMTKYSSLKGHTSPAPDEDFEGFPLGRWVKQFRIALSKGEVSPEIVHRLKSVPNWVSRPRG